MDLRTAFTTVGAGLTSALLVAVLVIELLDTELSAVVGLPVGLLAGVAVAVSFWTRRAELGSGVRRGATAYAAFGVALLLLLALRYVNVGRSVLTFDVVVGGSLGAVVAVYLALSLYDRNLP